MRFHLNLLGCLLFCQITFAQNDLALGEWAIHVPYNFGLSVTQSPNYIYYSTDLALWRINKIDRLEDDAFITKIDGLSRTEKSVLKYHPGTESVLVCYESGIIDIVQSSGITTMKDINVFDNFPIDKKINHVYIDGLEAVVVSGNFGISKIDIESKKVLWTAFTFGKPVYGVSRISNVYYAATEDGVYRIPVNGQTENFGAWEKLGESKGLEDGRFAGAVTRWRDNLYVGLEEAVYKLNDTTDLFEEIYRKEDYEIVAMSSEKKRLFVTYRCPDDCNSIVVDFDFKLIPTESSPECTSRTLDAIEDERGFVWYADQFNRFRLAPGNGRPCQYFEPSSPYSKNMNEVAVGPDKIAIASGGTINNFAYSYRNDGFFVLNDVGDWGEKNIFNDQELKDRDLKNFHRVRFHPLTGDQYYGTYWGGIVVYHPDGSYTFYNEDNSALRKKDAGDPRERVIGMEFDRNNNLWVASFFAPENALVVRLNDGTWKGFDPPNFGDGPNEVAVDSNGNKWITLTGDASRGVYVFNEGDINDDLDDQGFVYSQNNSELPSNTAISVAVDLDGDVWVGTDQGPVVFECGSGIFDGDCTGNRRKVEQDTIIAFLLETEEIRTIAVDGANRKWFGTRNGVFVQSSSGEDQILEFNEENSPLLSNVINDIAIDPENGLVYIATEKGLNVYRSDAVLGGRSHAAEVIAFPNPVRPGYNGPIAIKGLPRNADVKITDVAGTLIYETTSVGGQAIWDGNDYNGTRAKSGVYLVFSTSDAGDFESPEALVTKILIVN